MAQGKENVETVTQEVTAEVPASSVPFKNTTVGKTVRTLFQAALGTLLVVATALMASEDFRNLLLDNPEWSWVGVTLPVVIAALTFLQNFLDPTVKTI